MTRQNRSLGITIFVACVIAFIVYSWFLLVSEWRDIVLQVTVLAAVGGLFGVLAWVGLAMATKVKRPAEDIDNVQPDSKRSSD